MLAACFICSANPFHVFVHTHWLLCTCWWQVYGICTIEDLVPSRTSSLTATENASQRYSAIICIVIAISLVLPLDRPYLSMGAHQHLLLNTCGRMAGRKTRFYRTRPHPLLVSTLAWASCQSKLANPHQIHLTECKQKITCLPHIRPLFDPTCISTMSSFMIVVCLSGLETKMGVCDDSSDIENPSETFHFPLVSIEHRLT